MIWVWLKMDSIGMFARESLRTFSRTERDALYAVLNHEDRNWRRLHMEVARQAVGCYAMRWAIEVYFKEAKQYLGFLKEQSNHYAAYVASIHLTAMRFCMLMIAKSWHPSNGIADMRKQLTANAMAIDYATRLWLVFRAVIAGALEKINVLLGDTGSQVMAAIERHVQSFFVQSLQLDVRTLRLEAK